MPAPRSFDDKRAHIRALASAPEATAVAELRVMLADKNGYLVGEAAEVVKRRELGALTPDLAAAFHRLCEGAEDPSPKARGRGKDTLADKGCHGKNRIVEALLALDAVTPDVYLAGLRCEQPEPAFGAPIDTAAGLRGLCAHALFHINHPNALLEVAPLLFDPEPVPRAEAASAIGDSGEDAAAAVLHVKALAGDREPDVLGACYKGLLRLLPNRYLPFVASVLDERSPGDPEAAALALGESRLSGAFPLLRRALEGFFGSKHENEVLLAMGLLRSEEANTYLMGVVESGQDKRAESALNALALHRHDEKIKARLAAVVAKKGRRFAALFAEKFG